MSDVQNEIVEARRRLDAAKAAEAQAEQLRIDSARVAIIEREALIQQKIADMAAFHRTSEAKWVQRRQEEAAAAFAAEQQQREAALALESIYNKEVAIQDARRTQELELKKIQEQIFNSEQAAKAAEAEAYRRPRMEDVVVPSVTTGDDSYDGLDRQSGGNSDTVGLPPHLKNLLQSRSADVNAQPVAVQVASVPQ